MLLSGAMAFMTGSSRYSKFPGCRCSFEVSVTSMGSDTFIRSRSSVERACVSQMIEE